MDRQTGIGCSDFSHLHVRCWQPTKNQEVARDSHRGLGTPLHFTCTVADKKKVHFTLQVLPIPSCPNLLPMTGFRTTECYGVCPTPRILVFRTILSFGHGCTCHLGSVFSFFLTSFSSLLFPWKRSRLTRCAFTSFEHIWLLTFESSTSTHCPDD